MDEPCRVETLEASRQDQLRNQLLPVFCGRNSDLGSTFRSTYSCFITTQHVLDLLFPSGTASFPGTWMDLYNEASLQPRGSLLLQLLLPSMQLLMGGLNLEHQAHQLLAQIEDATGSAPVESSKPTTELEPSPGTPVEPCEGAAAACHPELESRRSGVCTRYSSLPLYNKRVGDSCLIHVYLENQRTTAYKSILVTCQDRAPTIIRRALDEHLLRQEDPEDFELLQIVSNHQRLRIPDDGNVYYALNGRVNYDFILRQRPSSRWFKVKREEFSERTDAVASSIPAAVSSSSTMATGPLPQATQSNESSTKEVTNSNCSVLHHTEQVEDSRFVHVLLEGQSRRETKRILVTWQEWVRSIIRRALDQNLLKHEDAEDFELLKMVSEHEKVKVPDHGLLYFSMHPQIEYNFILRKRPRNRAQVKGKELSGSALKRSRPLVNQQVGDTCLIRIQLEKQSAKKAKTVLVTCHDRAPVIIRRALELHFLSEEKEEDYELGQILSNHRKMKIPHKENVFYAMNPRLKYNFVLRKRTMQKEKDEWIEPKPPMRDAKEAQDQYRILRRTFWSCVSGQH